MEWEREMIVVHGERGGGTSTPPAQLQFTQHATHSPHHALFKEVLCSFSCLNVPFFCQATALAKVGNKRLVSHSTTQSFTYGNESFNIVGKMSDLWLVCMCFLLDGQHLEEQEASDVLSVGHFTRDGNIANNFDRNICPYKVPWLSVHPMGVCVPLGAL